MLPKTFIVWLAATYACVVVAVAIDFVSGVRKARRAGIKTNSRGYKRTCDKAVKYLLPMLCLSCVDFLASIFFVAPFLTMSMGAFNIFCEWKSVMESTHEKAEMRRAAESIGIIVDNYDDRSRAVAGLLHRLLQELDSEDEAERKEDGHAQH